MNLEPSKVEAAQGAPAASPQSLSYPTVLLVEVIGEPSVGKTHFVSLFPKPFMLDTTAKGESRNIFEKVLKLRGISSEGRYYHVKSWEELTSKMKEVKDRADIQTIILDTSADLQEMAGDAYLSRQKKARTSAIQIEYGRIRDIVDIEFIFPITAVPPNGAGKNLVLTSQMKRKYKQVQDPSGNVHAIVDGRERDGYSRLDFQSDVRLLLQLKSVCVKCNQVVDGIVCTKCGGTNVKTKRFGSVVKNRFLDQASDEWIASMKTVDWNGLKELLKGERIVE